MLGSSICLPTTASICDARLACSQYDGNANSCNNAKLSDGSSLCKCADYVGRMVQWGDEVSETCIFCVESESFCAETQGTFCVESQGPPGGSSDWTDIMVTNHPDKNWASTLITISDATGVEKKIENIFLSNLVSTPQNSNSAPSIWSTSKFSSSFEIFDSVLG